MTSSEGDTRYNVQEKGWSSAQFTLVKTGIWAMENIMSVTNIEAEKCVCVPIHLYMSASDKGLALHSNRSDADLALRSKGRATRGTVRATGW